MDTTCMCNKHFFGSYDLTTVIVETVAHILNLNSKEILIRAHLVKG